MSNPEVRRIAKRRLLEAIEKQPERRIFSVTQSDGYEWCQCKNCLALDTSPGVRTDRLLDFVNDIARVVGEKYPDRIINTLAYCKDTAPAPKRLKPEQNVRILLCPYTPEVRDRAHWFDHRLNRKFMAWYKGWVDLLPPGQLFVFDYPYADFRSLSFFHEHHFWRLKKYYKDGVRGIYYDAKDKFMFKLLLYVTSRLAWDPTLETRPMIEEFTTTYYGAAGPVMQDIYDYMSKIAAMPERPQGPSLDMSKFVTTEEVNELFAMFEKAVSLVKDSKLHLARVQFDKSHLLHTDIEKHNPVLGTAKNMELFKKRLSEYVKLIISEKSDSMFVADINKNSERVRSWFWRVARLRITAERIKDDHLIKRIITEPQTVKIAKSALTKTR